MPLLITLGVVVGTTVYCKTVKNKKPAIDLEGKERVDLLPLEGISLFEPPISTVTFFEGDSAVAVEYLRKRVADMVKRNPWLGGWLQIYKDEVKLFYDESGDLLAPGVFKEFNPGVVNLSNHTPYEEFGDVMKGKGVTVRCNADVINKDDEPLWRVSVVPDAVRPKDRFALVVSMSHMLGDAHTFYRMYNMLGTDAAIDDIIPKRKMEFNDAILELLGKKKAQYINEVGSNKMWEKWRELNAVQQGTEKRIYILSNSWVKAQVSAEAGGGADANTDDENYSLSANDVITSWFWRTVGATVGLMVVNCRNRLPMCTDSDAGNYLYPIPYSPDDYASPVMIRKSLDWNSKGGADQDGPGTLPKFSWDSTFSISTNWNAFSRDGLNLGSDCNQCLHLPLYSASDISKMPNRMSLIMIFTACPGKLGAFVMAPKSVLPLIESSGIVEKTLSKF